MWYIKDKVDDNLFVETCKEAKSMAEASATLKIHFNSFKKRAIELGCYNPNQSGKGYTKMFKEKYPLEEILEGKHPHFNTFKLKNKILKNNILENKCDVCKITEWNEKQINLELDHKDGNRFNHKLENLRLICPNCHSQTPTYRSKKRN